MNELALVPLADTLELGKVLAQSGFFEDSRQASQAVVKVLAGREIGIGPIASMTGIHIIKGKPAVGAGIIASAIKRSGRYNYRIRKHDTTVCEIEFFERNGDKWEPVGISTFTADDARKAGTQNMDKFARNMLFARCISNGAKWYTPDIFGGPVYTPEELGAPVNGEGEVIEGSARLVSTPAPDTEPAPTAQPSTPPPAPPPTVPANMPRLAILRTGNFPAYATRFADTYPAYTMQQGGPDLAHIRASLVARGYPELTDANIDQAFEALAAHAAAKAG